MKTKILFDTFYDGLEEKINEFIKDKKIIDIKCQLSGTRKSALVMYEEE